ncbi:MAG: FxLYD domain-containing protein [Sciscionella sp.]
MPLIDRLSRIQASPITWSDAMTTFSGSSQHCEQCERYRRRLLRLVWAVALAVVLLPGVGLWVIAVHGGDDEIVTLARNEVVQDASGGRIWRGAMLNTGDEYYDVEVRIRFLDQDNNTVGEISARADVLGSKKILPLEAPLPASAARMQMYSLHWRAGKKFSVGNLFGAYQPWEFGYLQYRAGKLD